MPNRSLLRCLASTAALLSLLPSAQLHAAPLADNVRLVADSFASANAAPDAQTFVVTQAGVYTVKVTDLASPSALASLSVAVASSGGTATKLTVTAPATTTSADVTLAEGTYTVQPLAVTASGSAGSFTVAVTPSGGSTPLFVGPWAVAATAASSPAGQSVLHKQFTVSDAGNYQLTVTDRAFPMALSDLQVIVLSQPDGATQCTIVSLAAPSCSLALGAGTTYDLIVVATADAVALQGLYSLKVVGGSTGTSTPYAATHPVGAMRAALNVPVATAENVTLQFKDLMYPAALGSASALVTQGPDVIQPLALGANASIPASAGTLQVFVVATAATTPGMGAYSVYATDAAGTLLDRAVAATDSTHTSYSFTTPLAAAGSYQFIVSGTWHGIGRTVWHRPRVECLGRDSIPDDAGRRRVFPDRRCRGDYRQVCGTTDRPGISGRLRAGLVDRYRQSAGRDADPDWTIVADRTSRV